MARPVLVAHGGSAESRDGIALGRLLGEVLSAPIHIAHIMADMTGPVVANDRASQQEIRARIGELHEALGNLGDSVTAVAGPSLVRGLHDLARDERSLTLVFGSEHHGSLAHRVFGTSAASVAAGSPCPVAVAPDGYADRGAGSPEVIGVAFDGSPESRLALRSGIHLSRAAGARLRLLSVHVPLREHAVPVGHGEGAAHHPAAWLDERAAEAAQEAGQGISVETALLDGDPARSLARAARDVDVLVAGSRGRGLVQRVVLGSVSSRLLRDSAAPLMVVPRGASLGDGATAA